VLILAKQKGIIPSVKENIERLIEIGFRLDKRLIKQVLNKLGEE
jgi:predicted nucleic acid-binding protein